MPAGAKKAVGGTWRRLAIRLVLSALPLAVFVPHAVGTRPLEFLTRVEDYLYDWRVRATLTRQVDPRIVIVDIDETSLGRVGQWPWPRDQMATLVNRLFDDFSVRVVGFDVVFPEPGGAETAAVFEELRHLPLAANSDVARELAAAASRLKKPDCPSPSHVGALLGSRVKLVMKHTTGASYIHDSAIAKSQDICAAAIARVTDHVILKLTLSATEASR